MEFIPTDVDDAIIVKPEPREDERGWFARVFCTREFGEHGMAPTVAQINLSETAKAGIVRGLHYQLPPADEAKLVRCVTGSIFDVVVDTRQNSATFGRWTGVVLTAEEATALYVPPGCAHGYQSLTDGARALYHASVPYTPGVERGVYHADPELAIAWPLEPIGISEKDRALPALSAIDPTELP